MTLSDTKCWGKSRQIRQMSGLTIDKAENIYDLILNNCYDSLSTLVEEICSPGNSSASPGQRQERLAVSCIFSVRQRGLSTPSLWAAFHGSCRGTGHLKAFKCHGFTNKWDCPSPDWTWTLRFSWLSSLISESGLCRKAPEDPPPHTHTHTTLSCHLHEAHLSLVCPGKSSSFLDTMFRSWL